MRGLKKYTNNKNTTTTNIIIIFKLTFIRM